MKVVIVGAGPAGLFSAYHLLKRGCSVELYDQMSGVGKKFLVAGNGGLNLTHSEPIEDFSKKYGKNQALFKSLLKSFSPKDLQQWCIDLGVDTFVGSSGRVFPNELTAADLLHKWLHALKENSNFSLYLNYRLREITKNKVLTFEHEKKNIEIQAESLILALGGSSWKKTGSDGKWKEAIEELGIEVAEFLPMNCGFERVWSQHFIAKVAHAPLKNIQFSFGDRSIRAEIMLTPYGIEGGGVYALSNFIRDKILNTGSATVQIDLKPDYTFESVVTKILHKSPKDSLTNFLRKSFKLDKHSITLIYELSDKEKLSDPNYLVQKIKSLELELSGIRPIDEAISTSGGVKFCELSESLEVETIHDMYIIGEMLDFEAPTGGYLLQACFSTAWRVVESICSSTKNQ